MNDNRSPNGWELVGRVIGTAIALAAQGFVIGIGVALGLRVMGVA